jgi:hypothetical protein
VLGTELARNLRRRGFRGFVIIRSGNDENIVNDVNQQEGDVNLYLDKSGSCKEVASRIHQEYEEFHQRLSGPHSPHHT